MMRHTENSFEYYINLTFYCMSAIAGIAAAVAAGSAIASLASQVDTNRTNKQIARETNQANLDLYREQYRDTKELNAINNEYNSPQNQVSMLQQAGLNPALAYGDNAVATQAALPSAPEMKSYQYRSPLQDVFSNLGNIIGDVASAYNESEEAKGKAIDNQTREAENIENLRLIRQVIKERQQNFGFRSKEYQQLEKQIQMLDFQLDRSKATLSSDIENARLQNDLIKQSIDSSKREQDRKDLEYLLSVRQTAYNERYTNAQIRQLDAMVRNLNDENWRANNLHSWDIRLKELDTLSKKLNLSDQQKESLFKQFMWNSEIIHTDLKDASLLNRMAERAFGLGFRDIGTTLRNLSGALK